MKTRHQTLIGSVALVTIASAAAPATGMSLLIDFGAAGAGNPGTTASPDINGNSWNNFVPGGFYSLVDTLGNMSGIGLSATTGVATNNPGGLTTPSVALLGDLAIASATQDYIFVSAGATAGFKLDGLDPTKTYDLGLFGTRATTATRETSYVVTGGAGPLSTSLVTSGDNIGSDGMYDGNDDTIANVLGVTPNGDGEILIDVSVLQGNFGYLGAMSIQVVPAPASLALIAIGGIAAGRRRR